MSAGNGSAAPESQQGQSSIAVKTGADTAALLAASRELVAEARRILAEAPKPAPDRQPASLIHDSCAVEGLALVRASKDSGTGLTRRLLTVVPAAAGIALLAAGVSTLAEEGRGQRALPADLQRPTASSSPSATPSLPAPSASVGASSSAADEAVLPAPLSLSVPRLHSSASVAGEVQVQTSGPEAGLLDAPADYHQLGWYRHGDTGALVLDGHVGFRADPGPLAFIGFLGAGDVVSVNFPSGQRNFAVTVVARAAKGQLPQEYFSQQYSGDLMLITCDYTSPFRAGHFADNVYVVADPTQAIPTQ